MDEWQVWLQYVQGADAAVYAREHLSAHPDWSFVPVEVPAVLDRRRREIQVRLGYMIEEFQRQAHAFHKNGIPFIALKGIYLSHSIYPNVTQRPFRDIDILCRQGDVRKAFEVLRGLGYVSPPQRVRHWLEHCYFNSPMLHDGPVRFMVDVHWNMGPSHRYRIDLDGVWNRSVPWQGETVRALCPEDLLLQLALHATYSYFVLPLAHWRDFARIAETLPVDSDVLAGRAREWQARSTLYVALKMALRKSPSPALDRLLARLSLSSFRRAALEKWVIGNSSAGYMDGEREAWLGRGRKELFNVLITDRLLKTLSSEAHRLCKWARYGTEPKEQVRCWRKAWNLPVG
jgi:hypothetical protein